MAAVVKMSFMKAQQVWKKLMIWEKVMENLREIKKDSNIY